jgi:hypothetical protein
MKNIAAVVRYLIFFLPFSHTGQEQALANVGRSMLYGNIADYAEKLQ